MQLFHWRGETALLLVPSVIVPEELNALINVAHPDAAQTVAHKVRAWHYDNRVRQARGFFAGAVHDF